MRYYKKTNFLRDFPDFPSVYVAALDKKNTIQRYTRCQIFTIEKKYLHAKKHKQSIDTWKHIFLNI